MKSFFEHQKLFWFTVLFFSVGRLSQVFANPAGLTVAAGSATIQSLGVQMNITVGQAAVLNWQTFNIRPGETTSFLQPSANSVVFNIIGDQNPSQIYGNLNAVGTVILANANGFYFGPNSMIKVGGSFIATTAPLAPDIGSSSMWQFTGMPPLASIVNYGQIEVGAGKSLYLIAEKIENRGSLIAPGGDVDLVAGQSVLVSDSADGRGLSAAVTLPQGTVDNFGRITADAGTITLQAKVVNQDGIIQADSIAEKNGVIELVAADQLNLGADSQILARGDSSSAGSAGGQVTLKSNNIFSDAVGSRIITVGGAAAGNGGDVEVSAPNIQSLNSAMDASAKSGSLGGEFLLDPVNIILGTTGTGMVPANGTVDSSGTGTLTLNVNTAFLNKNFSNIKLAATGTITLNAGTTWDLSASTGLTSGQLTLEAGTDIIFGDKSKIFDANDWSISLYAGYNFTSGMVQSGVGNIYLNGGSGLTKSGTLQLAAGDINLFAGQSILVAPLNSSVVSGSIFTTGGGNIFAYAAAGDIIAGTSNGGTSGTSQTSDYNFTDSGSTPNPFLGGISTAAGGNVTLIAGNNIDSTPKTPTRQAPGASGTYGSGDVTVIAGNQITGNFTLADGVGTMIAGVPVSAAQANVLQNPDANPTIYASTLNALTTAVKQSANVNGNIGAAPLAGNPSTSPVALSLISGIWNVFAANDISLKEVNNPNGAFNTSQSFLFNYAPDAAANFWAGNAIELVGANLGRLTTVNRTPIYAPVLSLNAGAGGILIDRSIILAPSSEGSLSVVTRNGGNLNGAVVAGSTVLNGITMSDSSSSDYTTYAAEHDNIHLPDPNLNPVSLNISGSINSFSLTVPTFADITVQGNTYNFGFKGRNLSPNQTTSIDVVGSITYRGNSTAIDLTPAELADPLPTALFTDSSDLSVTSKLIYDSASGKLIFVGVMSASDLAFLLNPSALVLDQNGKPVTQVLLDADNQPILDENGNFQYIQLTTPLTLDANQKSLINQLYTASQTASLGDQGLSLAGPGNFKVNANSLDLGVSGGIRVIAPDAGLAAISPYGADLTVTTPGNLSMTSTKISNESLLGDVTVNVGGTLDVGGEFTTLGDPSAAKGIFSTSGGNVAVIAGGDVNLNGSRIAAYNGGSITVESLNGNVNAGSGGAGYVSLNALELDPVTGLLTSIAATIPGSGILATTVAGSHATLGNILVESPNGDISANKGGIIQISFNGTDASRATSEILAGYELQDANGQRVRAQNISAGHLAPSLSAQNVVTLGTLATQITVGTISLIPLFDGSGNALLDAGGNPLYVKVSDASQQIVEIVNNGVQPFVNTAGHSVSVVKVADSNNQPYLDAQGNPVLVMSRNIEASGSGVIGQNVILRATGYITGLFVGNYVDYNPGAVPPPGPQPIVKSRQPPGIGGDLPPPQIIDPTTSTAAAPVAAPPVVAATADTAATVTTKTENSEEDSLVAGSNKKGQGISLAQKVSRVTVLLPRRD